MRTAIGITIDNIIAAKKMSDCDITLDEDVFADRSNLSDFQAVNTSKAGSVSFDMSIGGRAAMTEHLKLVQRHGIDYGEKEADLSWASWANINSEPSQLEVSTSDYFDTSRVLLLATPERKVHNDTGSGGNRVSKDPEGDYSFDVMNVSRISIDENSVTTPPMKSKTNKIRTSPASVMSLSTPKRSPAKGNTHFLGSPIEEGAADTSFGLMLSPIAARAADEAKSRGPVHTEASPFPFEALDVSGIEDQQQISFEQPSFEFTGRREKPSFEFAERREKPSFEFTGRREKPSFEFAERREKPSFEFAERREKPSFESAERREKPSFESAERRGKPSFEFAEQREKPSFESAERRKKPSFESKPARQRALKPTTTPVSGSRRKLYNRSYSFSDLENDQTGESITPTRDPLELRPKIVRSASMRLNHAPPTRPKLRKAESLRFDRMGIPDGDRRRYRTVVPTRVYLHVEEDCFDEQPQEGAYEF